MSETNYYLYKIANKVNGKLYIGITKNPRLRKWQHFNHRHPSTISVIKLAIDKYGKDNFEFEVICIGTRSYIQELESKAIEAYNTVSPNGYNVACGGEGATVREVKKRSDDEPVYVTGFWFPNLRTAVRKTGIPSRTIRRWEKDGKIGDIVQPFRRTMNRPIYVSGFWFPSTKVASSVLGIQEKTIRQRVARGFVEAVRKEKEYPRGENHPFFGKKGGLCHNSKPCVVEGNEYLSLSEAVKATGYSETKIRRRIKSGDPNFKFKEET